MTDDWTIPMEIIECAKNAGAEVFIQTGYGPTHTKAEAHFEEVYSIEIDEAIAKRAMVQHAPGAVILGDSREKLAPLVKGLGDRRALIWLDGHYSGKGTGGKFDVHTALRVELAVLGTVRNKRHIIAVDDLVDCNGTYGYPTIDELREALEKINPDYKVDINRGARKGRGYALTHP